MYINDGDVIDGYRIRSVPGYEELNYYRRGGRWGRIPHEHSHMQYLVVTKGSICIICGEETRVLVPGCASVIAPGVRHEIYSATSEGYEQIGANIFLSSDNKFGGLVDLLNKYIVTSAIFENASLQHRADEYISLLKNGSQLSAARAAAMINSSLLELLERLIYGRGAQTRFDEALSSYLDAYLADNLKVSAIADQFHMSVSQMERLTRTYFGMGVIALYNQKRLRRACILLNNGWQSVSEIAHQVGFSDAANFSNFFRKQIGLSPTNYRNRMLRKNEGAADERPETRHGV